jgi:hypothetical protein
MSDLVSILQEVRGTSETGQPYVDGIYWELTIQDHNGNAGVYGDIIAIYNNIYTFGQDFYVKYQEVLDIHGDVLVLTDQAQAAADYAAQEADRAEREAWEAQAAAMTAESTASAPVNTYTTIYSSNGDGTFREDLSCHYSAYHYSVAAMNSNRIFLGFFDASSATELPEPAVDEGHFYVVIHSGTIDGIMYSVGDELIWSLVNRLWMHHLQEVEWWNIRNIPRRLTQAVVEETIEADWNWESKGSLGIPTGTDAERPQNPQLGAIRINTDQTAWEGYNGTAWVSLA